MSKKLSGLKLGAVQKDGASPSCSYLSVLSFGTMQQDVQSNPWCKKERQHHKFRGTGFCGVSVGGSSCFQACLPSRMHSY